MAELKWVADRCRDSFLPELAALHTEDQVKERCLAEIQYWLSRGLAPDSLRTPHSQSRKLIELSSLSGEQKTWALQHLSLGEARWTELNVAQAEALATRKTSQQLLTDPDRIIRQAEALLESERWADIAAGLMAVTGRRSTEILKNATFEEKTVFSVMFSGQLKQRSNQISVFEIPTLTEASRVLDAYQRLRAALDTSNMSESAVENAFNRAVNTSIKRHFEGLIPAREGDNITSHVLRAVYLRLAIFFYAPVLVDADHYVAMISGHRSYAGGQERLSYAAGANYSDYKIADNQGNIDGRQGVRLGQPGVEVLAVFSGSHNGASPVVAPKKGMAVQARLPVSGVLTPESLFSGEMLELIKTGMEAANVTDFTAYLTMALKRQARADLGIARRDTVADVSRMSLEELAKTRKPATAKERIRRAVAAIAAYNDSHVQLERWYVNATVLGGKDGLIGGRFETILEWLKEHQGEVDAINKKYGLTKEYNRKPIKIKAVVVFE